MKKLLLGLGSLAAVIAPVAAVVACGADSTTPTKGANENGAGINHKDAVLSFKTSSEEDVNEALAKAVAADVNEALAKSGQSGYYKSKMGYELLDSNDWNINIQFKKGGFTKEDSRGNILYSDVAKEGFIPDGREFLTYTDASMKFVTLHDVRIDKTNAVEINAEGIKKFFASYAHGGLSLSFNGPVDQTGFDHTMSLVYKLMA